MTVDWSQVSLVVFDLDGTLYDQQPVRAAMALALASAAVRRRRMDIIRILREYRKTGENLPDAMPSHYGEFRFSQTARRCKCDEQLVRETVNQWMHIRPLPLLAKYRAQGIETVFHRLRASGRKIVIWSDYPVTEKLASLGLQAQACVWTGDGVVEQPKPDPQGLEHILQVAQVEPHQTLMIGDRFDRDFAPAAALSVPTLMRSRKRDERSPTFWRYTDPVFAPLLAGH